MQSNPSDRAPAWRSGAAWLLTLLVAVASVGLLAVVYSWARRHDISFAVLTRDPVAQSNLPYFAGYLCYLGAILWCAAAAVCLFCVSLGPRRIGARWCGFFLIAGGLSAVMTADELMQLHEEFLPRMFGIRERWVMLSYGLVGLLMLAVYFPLIRQTAAPLLVLSCICFVLSLSVDRKWLPVQEMRRHLLEDGSKFVAIASWCVYFLHTCATRLRRSIDARFGPT